jgi:hypothetical protein
MFKICFQLYKFMSYNLNFNHQIYFSILFKIMYHSNKAERREYVENTQAPHMERAASDLGSKPLPLLF